MNTKNLFKDFKERFKVFKNILKTKSKFKRVKDNQTKKLFTIDLRYLFLSPLIIFPKLAVMEEVKENQEAESTELDIKDIIKGEYENRLRTFSTIEKKYHIFANIKNAGEAKMSYIQFLHSLIPFQYIKTKSIDEVDKILQDNNDFKKIMNKVDINKDGLIDFEEYIIMCVFASLPLSKFQRHFSKNIITKEELVEYIMKQINSKHIVKVTDKSLMDARIVKTDYNTLYKDAVDFISNSFTNNSINITTDVEKLKIEIMFLLLFYEVFLLYLVLIF